MLSALIPPSASAADTKEGVLKLDEIVVHAARINPHPWRYIAIPGYEILSQCDSDQTEDVARHIANALELERRLMPADSWGDLPVPLTLIMFDFEPAKSLAAFVPKALKSIKPGENFGSVILAGKREFADVRLILNNDEEKEGGVDTGDPDTHCIVQNRWKASWAWSGGALGRGPIPLGRFFRFNRAVPAMPSWFKYGLVGPCCVFRMRAIRAPGTGAFMGRMVVAAATWLTEADTNRLVSNYKKLAQLPVLPPVGELFRMDNRSMTSVLDDWPAAEYMAEAALFVRWGMTPVAAESGKEISVQEARRLNEAHATAFARFTERSRREPVTEAVFNECFGFGYSEMQRILSEYLVTRAQQPFLLNSHVMEGFSPDQPAGSTRPASSAEIGRIIGDWLRMKAASLPEALAAEREEYLRAAGRVLERTFREENNLPPAVRLLAPTAHVDPEQSAGAASAVAETPVAITPAGFRDPRLLAVYGLYYLDTGDAASARILLEAAVHAQALRPAAYVALARLNRDAAVVAPAGENGKLSPDQVAGILTPLFTVYRKWALDVSGYLLIADAWSHSAAKPALANLQVLVEGMHRYPFDSSLLSATAKLYAQWGYWAEAHATVHRSAEYADSATAQQLRSEQAAWPKLESVN